MTDLLPVSDRAEGQTVLGVARERWKAARRGGVTASDCAAILGYVEGRSALSVYAEKVGALEPDEEDYMAFGRDVEGAIAKAYTRRTGRIAVDLGANVIQWHPDIPWLGATLDRQTAGNAEHPAPADGPGPLECKAVAGMKARDWEEEPPVMFQIQVQIQMACTGADWGSLVALFGGIQVAWKDLLRNDRFIALALPKLEEFWWRVQRREPPEEVDAKAATTDALKALYATADGSSVDLDEEARKLADAWESACVREKVFKDEAALLENKLRRLIGPHTLANLPDGTWLKAPVTNVKGHAQKAVDPYSYRRITRGRPRLLRRNG